jgi:hypothetical protein
MEVFDPNSTWGSTLLVSLLYNLGTDHIENTASKYSSVVACLFISVEMCLLTHYGAMASSSAIMAQYLE